MQFEDPENVCLVPPSGWICTRRSGHGGPCAAWPVKREGTAVVLLGFAFAVIKGLGKWMLLRHDCDCIFNDKNCASCWGH